MPRSLQQTAVVKKLAMAGKKLMRDRIELPATKMMVDRWEEVKDDIIAHARGTWEREHADESPMHAEVAKQKITSFMDLHLKRFRDETVDVMNTAKVQAFEQQYLVDNWILDQVTPPNIKVRPKRNAAEYAPSGGFHHKIGVKEAWWEEPIEGTPNQEKDGDDKPTGKEIASGEQRVDGYLKAWQGMALASIGVAAFQGDDSDAIASRLNATTAAGNDISPAFNRLIKTEVQVSVADADDKFDADHAKLLRGGEEVWVTMDDERVCIICRSNEGKTRAKATYTIPAHNICRCWWRVRPRNYKQLAGEGGMAVPGVASQSMVFRDPVTGKPQGAVVVSFGAWVQSLAN